jgi:Uma2 family endonuclease
MERTMAPELKKERQLLTAEELWQMGDIGRCELVEGELIRMNPTSGEHGRVATAITIALGTFVRQHRLGDVLSGEVGFFLRRDPDTVRGVDVMFYASGRLADVDMSRFLELPPDLAVEVISPGDRWTEVQEKVGEYLDVGVRLIWMVDPVTRSVHIYSSEGAIRRLSEDDILDGGDALPGFALPVGDLFG